MPNENKPEFELYKKWMTYIAILINHVNHQWWPSSSNELRMSSTNLQTLKNVKEIIHASQILNTFKERHGQGGADSYCSSK